MFHAQFPPPPSQSLRASTGTDARARAGSSTPDEVSTGCLSCLTALLPRRRARTATNTGTNLNNLGPRRAAVFGRTAKFEKISTEEQSQYLLDGHPVFGEPYARQQEKPASTRAQRVLAEDTQSTVYERRNPNAPVLVKVAKFLFENSAKVLDDLALKVLTAATDEVASHFALEIRHDKLKGNTPCTLTRRVNGHTLDQFFRNPSLAGSMSVDDLAGKVNDLQEAVAWLNAQGFEHRDIHPKNVMIDLDSNKLVLIDFPSQGSNHRLSAGQL
jgi:serine/threonine protein kinase